MLTLIKVYACFTVKIYKNKPQRFFKTGGSTPGAPVLDPPLNFKLYFFYSIWDLQLEIAVCLYKNITFNYFDPFKWNYLLNREDANSTKIRLPLK